MHKESLENSLLSKTINPLLKAAVSTIDQDCPEDGSLLLNSLKRYLGADVKLCSRCTTLSRRVAKPFYEVGTKAFRLKKDFLRSQFLNAPYGEV